MKLTKLLIAVAISLASTAVWARVETVSLRDSSFSLDVAETQSVSVGGYVHIKKLIVRAESRVGGTFEVLVNGEVKGTIYVPGHDPSYIVTVEDNSDTVQLRQISGGAVCIKDIKAVVDARTSDHWHHRGELAPESYDSAVEIGREAIELVDSLRDYVDPIEFNNYLLPIKKAAARLIAKASARGDLSQTTVNALDALGATIEANGQFLDKELSREVTFDTVTNILALQEQIKKIVE